MIDNNMDSLTAAQVYPWNQALWSRLTQRGKQAPQALLLSGVTGLGKRQLAIQYAAFLLNADDVFYHGNHPDCHVLKAENNLVAGQLLSDYAQRYITPTKGKAKPKTVITVAQVRHLIEQINQFAQLSDQKVILVDGADTMNTNAANALLKTLEEPVSNTCFILITDQLERLPATIKSRCVLMSMRAPDKEIGLQWLQQQTQDPAIQSYLSMAGNAPLAALEFCKADYIATIRAIFTSLNELLAGTKTALDAANSWQKFPVKEVVVMLQKLLMDVFKFSSVATSNKALPDTSLFFPVQRDWVEKISTHANQYRVIEVLDEIKNAKQLLETTVDEKLVLENLAFSFAKLIETKL